MGSRRSTTRQPSSAPIPLYLPHCFRLFPSTSSPLSPLSHSQSAPQSASPLNYQPMPPQPLNPSPLAQGSPSPLNYHQLLLNPFQLVQKSVLQLDSQQFPPNPLSSPFYLAQKCAPTPPQVQNPALKCARPFLNGFKMRAACAPRCANFPKNPISSPKTRKTAIFDNTPRQIPQLPASEDRPPAGASPWHAGDAGGREETFFTGLKQKWYPFASLYVVCIVDSSMNESSTFSGEAILWPRR